MKWVFAPNNGGRESGLNDAGVETFKGDFDRYLARELIQNSLDARLDPIKPVHVQFELLELKRDEIPDLKGLKTTFDRCAEYWEGTHQKRAKEFFEEAANLVSAKTITALRVGDYNTTGVRGSDTDKRKHWYNLIRCAGSSSKAGDEGGSYGIGKNAPFAASRIRTVLYSTYNEDKEHIFQGVAVLVSHLDADGTPLQPVGYLGSKGDGLSVRSKDDIPEQFLRTKKGTDLVVLGFPARETWDKDLVYSVLENFWPAIDLGNLVVTVGAVKITASNLAELLEKFSGEEDFSGHIYYKAFKDASHSFNQKLTHLKDVTLYLSSGSDDLPKKIAMVRKTGMIIFHKQFRCVIPFCGVFICVNETGNKLLRDMEPPKHDIWSGDYPEKGMNKHVEAEYVQFIRDCIKNLLTSDSETVISVPGLNRFLPDDDDSEDDPLPGGEREKQESPERSQLPEKLSTKRIDPRQSSEKPGGTRAGEDDEEEDERGRGKGKGKGKKKTGEATESRPPIPIRYRTFATNASAGIYSVTVESQQAASAKATITLWTVGDDGKAPAGIRSARFRDGKVVPVRAGVLGPLILPKNKGALHFEVRLDEPMLVAMEVAAHEVEQ
jgi:hypothetical protein